MDPSERLKSGVTERRRYSREELFRLAGLMKEFEGVLADELEELKNASWTRYQLEFDSGADCDPPNGPASLASWGRKKSELMGEFADSAGRYFTGAHRKMHRMTSSPSIKYNKSEPPELGTLSSQVQAKYARLIETLSKSNPLQMPPPTASQSQRRYELPPSRLSLTGTTSHNSARLDESNPRRPTSVFGPLRRRPTEGRRGSDEPMSLPYSINMHAQRNESQTQMDDARGASQQRLAADLETPIRRIGAQTQARAHEDERQRPADCPSDVEEDDFDITSLLSITVLSDIRTLRQDSSSAAEGGLTRQSSRPLPRRAKSHDMAVRMPARARTSIEFDYSPESRRPPAEQNLVVSPARATFAQQMAPYETQASQQYSSLNETHSSSSYGWLSSQRSQQSGLFVDPEVALKYHLERAHSCHATKADSAGPQSSAQKEPVDEKVVKIIETFKAQVRARAEASENEPAQNKQQPSGSAPSDHQPKEPGGKSAAELKEGPTGESVSASTNHPEVNVRKADREAAEMRSLSSSSQPQPQTRPPPSSVATAPRVSNIPRLISLHRPNSGQPSAGDALKPSTEARNNPAQPEASLAGAPSQSKTNDLWGGGRSNIKASNKFASKYKSLRGKSLADEVEESSPK